MNSLQKQRDVWIDLRLAQLWTQIIIWIYFIFENDGKDGRPENTPPGIEMRANYLNQPIFGNQLNQRSLMMNAKARWSATEARPSKADEKANAAS